MAKKWLDKLNSNKNRTLILLLSIVLFVIIVAVIFLTGKPNPLKTDESRTTKIPQITAIPGGATSEKYQELQEADNRRIAEQAKKKGGSAVATIIGNRDNDLLSKKESFGIEGEFLKAGECKCPAPTTPSVKPACPPDLELALKSIINNKEAAKKMLMQCPAMAKLLAERNPEMFKQLMLENPELAKMIGDTYPEVIKKLMESDPAFAAQLAKTNPDLVKNMMMNDPDFAGIMAKTNPDMVKDLSRGDPEFSKKLAQNNPAFVKKMMLNDPEFAKLMAKSNPTMIKELMKGDPEFARALAKNNATLVKELMKNDAAFADLMGQQNPEMVKKLMLDDLEFAKIMARNNPDMVATLMENDPAFAKELLQKIPDLNTILDSSRKKLPFLTDKQRLQALEETRRKQQEEQKKRVKQTQLSEMQQKQLAALMASMEAQSKKALDDWIAITPQAFVQGDKKASEDASGGSTAAGGAKGGGKGESTTGKVLIKAGTILFAVLDTAVNTDEPGPVMATIVQGEFQGAKIIGTTQMSSQPGNDRPEKVTLNFATMSTPNLPKSLPIQGVAIDTDTARTALASEVDHHYLLRYGTLFASSFMNGYAKVITSSGTVQTNSGTGASTTTTPQISGRKEVFAALGEVGKKFGDATSTYFTRPNTITVNAGTGIGLLILSDVTASQ
ncbi:MAG TPA: TrbI/VirB10 family protein [Gammaproteobacteria bacterium]|nr:TrbI/VirB10 family protein [Gammaproteobacteria bacterium]